MNVREYLYCGPSSGLPKRGGLDEGPQLISFIKMLRGMLLIVTECSLLSRPPTYCILIFFSESCLITLCCTDDVQIRLL